jgi:hypothetical protein
LSGTSIQTSITIKVIEDPTTSFPGNKAIEPYFDIFPNPADDMLHIHTSIINYRVDIYNLQGSLVFCSSDNGGATKIDISNLQNGLYIANILSENHSEIVRVIKN